MIDATGMGGEKITLFTVRCSYGEFSHSPANLQEVFLHFGSETSSGRFVEGIVQEGSKVTKVKFFGQEKECQHDYCMDLKALLDLAGITGSICPW